MFVMSCMETSLQLRVMSFMCSGFAEYVGGIAYIYRFIVNPCGMVSAQPVPFRRGRGCWPMAMGTVHPKRMHGYVHIYL